jgi:hypothetical protein
VASLVAADTSVVVQWVVVAGSMAVVVADSLVVAGTATVAVVVGIGET